MTSFKAKRKINFESIKIFIIPFLVLSLILISFSYLLRPKIEEISQIIGNIKTKEDRLVRLTEKLSILKSLNEPELTRRSGLVLESLPERKEPMLVMGILRRFSSESGMEMEKISVEPGGVATESGERKKEEKVPSLSFSLQFSGSFDQVDGFIKKLDKTFPLLRAEEISFRRSGSSDRLTVSTQVFSYYFYFPQSLGKIDAPVQVITEEERKIADRLKQFSLPFTPEEPFLPMVESGRANPFI